MAWWKRLPGKLRSALKRGEKCHYVGRASWYEMPRRPRRKGKKVEDLVRTDVGIVYFTSHRIIFDGLQGRRSVSLTSLGGMKVLPNGIDLKRRNKHRLIKIEGDVEEAAAVLTGLLAIQITDNS